MTPAQRRRLVADALQRLQGAARALARVLSQPDDREGRLADLVAASGDAGWAKAAADLVRDDLRREAKEGTGP